jgi:crotonobetainyl-CoA:carnitine CoA-transferase CaiB-like acyl-CoA transferase
VAGACAGLRVLDFTQGRAGPMATMILADYGAEVIRVEPAEGDPGWDDPTYLLLNRGKKSIDLDLRTADGKAELGRLVAASDVVIESMGAGRAGVAGIGYQELSAVNAGLVYCSLTGYGKSGPFAGVPADDALAMAKAGILKDQDGWYQDGKRPVFRAPKDASYFTAMLAVQGILSALRARDLTGLGQLVETDFLRALTCRQNPKVRWILRHGEELPPDATAKTGQPQDDEHTLAHHQDPRQVNLIGMMVECKDGRWLIHSLTEPHFFPAWISVIGFDWIWQDERFKGAPYRFPDLAAKEELIGLVRDRMKEQTAAEWMAAYLDNGNVCGDVIQTTREALEHPQMIEAGYLTEVDDQRVGRMVQIGPLVKLRGAAPTAGSRAPLPGEHSEEIRKMELAPLPAASPKGEAMKGPLDGITIVEAAYYYATPFATALMAELGARVIKIERLEGDPYRALNGDPFATQDGGSSDPILNLGQNNMVRAMQGKECLALNLKDPRGREILHRLIREADAFVHSFRPGVPESLGIDYETLQKINPNLVYHYAGSYGSIGPYRRQPAIDPIIAAFAGTTAYQTGEGNPPLREAGADPIGAVGHATSLMLGLYARHRSGEGQYVESAMILSNLYMNGEDAFDFPGKEPRPAVDRLQLGTGATYRLYQTGSIGADISREPYENPDPRWVFLAAVSDRDFAAFCRVAECGALLTDPRFATAPARVVNRATLEARLEGVFNRRSALEWERELQEAGVGCVVADGMSHFAYLYRDPQAAAIGAVVETEHPSLGGVYWRYAPVISLSRTPARALPYCEKGEHTREILARLRYGSEEVNGLREAGVVTWPSADTEGASVAG